MLHGPVCLHCRELRVEKAYCEVNEQRHPAFRALLGALGWSHSTGTILSITADEVLGIASNR